MKTAVITGGNSGIGKATALALAKKGYKVIIHGKDAEKTKLACEELKKLSGNIAIEFVAVDITTILGMKRLASEIKSMTSEINALVLSTGIILPKHVITLDKLEKGFAIQYLSRFAITQLLLPELKTGNAKIVHVGAPVIKGAKIHFDDIALNNEFKMIKAMAQEMFANHLFVQEFAKRNPDNKMVMNMANVGIAKTEITRNVNFVFKIFVSIFGKSAEKAASNFAFLASDETVYYSGYFLPKPNKPSITEKLKYDPIIASRLWDLSLQLIK
ncbi:MAG: SDR family NAD(P)-dependent oxidoreductase [Bacteroidota bacterium]